jgi:hypothetical protein
MFHPARRASGKKHKEGFFFHGHQLDLAITGQVSITVTTTNIDLTTGSAQDPTAQLYKALRNVFLKLTGAMTGN